MAERFDKDIDIHLHEPGVLGAFSIELIAERTKALGFGGRVVISHAFSLGGIDEAYLGRLIDLLLDNDIAIMSHGPSGGRLAPPLKQLHDAGVRLCAGNDGIRDTWGPLNMPDMLLRAFLVTYRNNFRRDEDIEIALGDVHDRWRGRDRDRPVRAKRRRLCESGHCGGAKSDRSDDRTPSPVAGDEIWNHCCSRWRVPHLMKGTTDVRLCGNLYRSAGRSFQRDRDFHL